MTGVPRFVQQSLGRGLCPSGKHAYEHRSDAKAELGRARSADHSHHRMSTYRCEACGFFHIGHVPASKVHGRGWFA